MLKLNRFDVFVALLMLIAVSSCSIMEGDEDDGGEVSIPRIVSHEITGTGNSDGTNDLRIYLNFESSCEGRTEFNRKFTDANGSQNVMIGQEYGTSNSFVDDGEDLEDGQLNFGNTYVYTAITYCDDGQVSDPSSEYTVSTPGLIPPTTLQLEWDSTENAMRLSWPPSEMNNASYEIYRGNWDRYQQSFSGSSSIERYWNDANYTDEGVRPGDKTFYTIQVISDQWGYSKESERFEFGAIPVPVPQGVQANWSDEEPQSITITWSPLDDVDYYVVYRSLNSAEASPQLLDTVKGDDDGRPANYYAAPDTVYTDKDILWGNAYYYRVQAVYSRTGGEKSAFAEAIMGIAGRPPQPPDSGWVTQGLSSSYIDLVWNYVPGVTSYKIMRLQASAGADPEDATSYTQVAEFTEADMQSLEYTYGTNNSEGRYVDTDVLTGTKYYYRILSVGPFGDSDSGRIWEGWVGTLISPTSPAGLQVSDGLYSDAVEVRWNTAEQASAYRVYRNETGSSFTEDDAVSGWITDTLWVHEGTTAELSGGYYTVQAMHEGGGVSSFPDALAGSADPSSPSYADGPITTGPGSLQDVTGSVAIHAAGDINLLAGGTSFYLLLADADDADKRAKVMTASGSAMEWTNYSDYVSDSAVAGDELRGFYDGDFYLTYASAGDDETVRVKYWDNRWADAGAGALGTRPFVTRGTNSLWTVVWRTPNGGIIGSMFLNNGWTSASYWADNFYSTNQLEVDNEGGTIPVVAEESGGPGVLDVVFHKKDVTWQSAYGTFSAPGTGMLDFYGLEVDASGSPFFAYHSWTSGGDMAGFDIVNWDGSQWNSTGLSDALENVDFGMDIDMTEKSGSDIYAAVAYRTTDTRFNVQLWEYTSGTWQQKGPTVIEENAVGDVEVVLDSQGNPVLVYRMSADGEIRTRVYVP